MNYWWADFIGNLPGYTKMTAGEVSQFPCCCKHFCPPTSSTRLIRSLSMVKAFIAIHWAVRSQDTNICSCSQQETTGTSKPCSLGPAFPQMLRGALFSLLWSIRFITFYFVAYDKDFLQLKSSSSPISPICTACKHVGVCKYLVFSREWKRIPHARWSNWTGIGTGLKLPDEPQAFSYRS